MCRPTYVYVRSPPHVCHSADALASPLLSDDHAFGMVGRYYAALNTEDEAPMSDMLVEDWIGCGPAAGPDGMAADLVFDLIDGNRAGMCDTPFFVEDVHVSNDVVTVIGLMTGTHTGGLLGIPASRREVAFTSVAVHRVEDGRIAEPWITSDHLKLLQ